MVDRNNPYEIIKLAAAIFQILENEGATGGDYMLKDEIIDHLPVENDVARDLIESLANHESCPLNTEVDDGIDKVYLRRTDSLTAYIQGLKSEPTNPLDF